MIHGLTWDDTTTVEALEDTLRLPPPGRRNPQGEHMASQLSDRYGDVREAIDELRDAVLEAGPGPEVHRDAMRQISAAHPDFFLDFTLALAAFVNDGGEVDDATVEAVDALYVSSRDVVVTAHDAGAARLAAALESLGVTLRITGKGGK